MIEHFSDMSVLDKTPIDIVPTTDITELESDNQLVNTCGGNLPGSTPSRKDGIKSNYVNCNLVMEAPITSEGNISSPSTSIGTSILHKTPMYHQICQLLYSTSIYTSTHYSNNSTPLSL